MHFHRHIRFYFAAVAGLATGFFTVTATDLRILLAGDAFFVVYLALTARYAASLSPETMRRNAVENDEGVAFILAASALVVAFSLGAIFAILNRPQTSALPQAALAMASVPLGWLMLQTMTAFHYATMYYAPGGENGAHHGGLNFPKTDAPGVIEFLYFSFVLGMAVQVSDVSVETGRFRRVVLLHSVGSFFYNTVLLALAVNAGLAFAGGH